MIVLYYMGVVTMRARGHHSTYLSLINTMAIYYVHCSIASKLILPMQTSKYSKLESKNSFQ